MAKVWEEHICKICHKKFMTGSKRSKYCSPECSTELSTINLAKFCAITKTDANWLLGLKREEKI